MPVSKGRRGAAEQAVLETLVEPRPALDRQARPGFVLLDGVEYPYEDDEPMANSLGQLYALLDLVDMLRRHFAGRQDVLVAGDYFILYEEGRPDRLVAPDVLVALDLDEVPRKEPYFVWKHGKAPEFVLEIASRKTARRDARVKPGLYQAIGVREYWLFDPVGGLYSSRLKAYELRRGRYVEMESTELPGGGRAISSLVLGLDLRFEDERLRLWDPVRQGYVLTSSEAEAAWRELEGQAQREAATRQEAEARAKRETDARQEAEVRPVAKRRPVVRRRPDWSS